MVLDKVQQNQDAGYYFPYHHIPEYKKNFTQCYNFPWGINYAAILEFVFSKIQAESFTSLVDIGCGDGRITKEVRAMFPHRRIEGIDYSEKSINLARSMDRAGIYHHRDITETALPDQYNMALLIEVFEHIPPKNGATFLQAVSNLLDKNGTLLMTVPHANLPVPTKHYRHFTLDLLSQCLDPYFTIEEVVFLEKIDQRKKIIDTILTNKLFILNSTKLKNAIYRYYKNNLFFANSEQNCSRMYIKAQTKK